MDLTKITTEKRNKNSKNIDRSSTMEILKIINKEDALIAKVVSKKLADISEVVDLIYQKFQAGGRLIYIGAGSSGRIGILDASEMLPTYGISTERIFGIIAGGDDALKLAKEGVEDNELLAIEDLKAVNFNANDILIGITASGRTPYVLSALKYCRAVKGLAIGLTMTTDPELSSYVEKVIIIETGQEVITGSTRMKAGTATKLVLNMISTALMVKYGKVYQNLMVDLVASNEKLKARVVNIVATITDADSEVILKTLATANYNCKNAIVMLVKNVDYQDSVRLLAKHNGSLAQIL
ncbi:N-acetylmuramic acid 6-phosphate etherase [Spiroplasma platyhelix]|uniref:N-acetylmuramic acid 6-phosphate etherase n=1 Tax=Spiroplasma platyhelix PALS-1 TaxID=1276218 RepID=A0A846TVH6_9MOLU|nr:N-acetylmuramic acid 6-phosphate etherase [Spiroplasma platyhelix]MBE4703779.1 N-acetylmuramic acid 6-phosphate etherase [Spiroplasma platyhelix PALS-1]NKE38152.1 N-acetylmuramic acid 6-phosphate etherase [Spiroplasma platyhelix PALS-1]UJB29037.1 N-acetylmuramic acid 6-phosphate etherase [Spiroplasma platyhelix PALS-1]